MQHFTSIGSSHSAQPRIFSTIRRNWQSLILARYFALILRAFNAGSPASGKRTALPVSAAL